MPAAAPPPCTDPVPAYAGDADRWRAVAARDRDADGRFVYAVRTTGVYCRPSCAARLARRANVEFHASPAEAERAGFRACKRCRPEQPSPAGTIGVHAAAIAQACRSIVEADEPPDVPALAAAAGLSPSHFHRVFRSLAGITPKAYATAHRARRVRDALARGGGGGGGVTSAIYQAGFNSSGRFYATSGKALGMKPAAFRAGGAGERIRFAVGESSLGLVLVAATSLGVCAISFGDDAGELAGQLLARFRNAEIVPADADFRREVAAVVAFVDRPGAASLDLPLDVHGTAFQQRVWQALCKIPRGTTRTYSEVARALGTPSATRAVAGACAANPVAVAIPCHRVVRTSGSLAGYRWGVDRKAKLLEAERRDN